MENVPDENSMGNTPSPVSDGKPYFMGSHALIQFSGGEDGLRPSTYWLVSKDDHTIRPFESQAALNAVFGANSQDALQNTVTVSPPNIDQHGNISDGVLAVKRNVFSFSNPIPSPCVIVCPLTIASPVAACNQHVRCGGMLYSKVCFGFKSST